MCMMIDEHEEIEGKKLKEDLYRERDQGMEMVRWRRSSSLGSRN